MKLFLVLYALFAVATAVPYYGVPRFHDYGFGHFHVPHFSQNIFNMQKFWDNMSQQMRQLQDMVSQLTVRLPSYVPTQGYTQGYVDNQYIINISLSGFERKDIVVKARDGFLMVQATHINGPNNVNNFVYSRGLPDNVNATGNWTYDNGVLQIIFPLKGSTERPVSTTETVTLNTDSPSQSSEEVGKKIDEGKQDADVGLNRGDLDSKRVNAVNTEAPILPEVEATTHVDNLKEEVELVPVRY